MNSFSWSFFPFVKGRVYMTQSHTVVKVIWFNGDNYELLLCSCEALVMTSCRCFMYRNKCPTYEALSLFYEFTLARHWDEIMLGGFVVLLRPFMVLVTNSCDVITNRYFGSVITYNGKSIFCYTEIKSILASVWRPIKQHLCTLQLKRSG